MATDYTTPCASQPLSFIQMLASTIFGYHDIAGILHYRINVLGVSGDCVDLSSLLTCNTSHIEPERQLVENVFALDDCSLLAVKIFNNSSVIPTDYGVCTEMPQSLIQMLARTIVTYNNINRINIIAVSDSCELITPLLNCITNSIESERLLVANIFGVDDCSHPFLKLFVNSSTATDYTTPCEATPQSFYQMLARCIVSFNGIFRLNVFDAEGYCDDLHAFWTCAINHIPPERALVENVFATDSCGNLGLKLFGNAGEKGGRQGGGEQ